MKKIYEQPEMDVIIAVAEDVILVSDNWVDDPWNDNEVLDG
jgi:hypothetical protein